MAPKGRDVNKAEQINVGNGKADCIGGCSAKALLQRALERSNWNESYLEELVFL